MDILEYLKVLWILGKQLTFAVLRARLPLVFVSLRLCFLFTFVYLEV